VNIRDYWESQAQTYGASPEASWGDSHAIELEIAAISERLQDGDTVLDAGCGNGYAAIRQWMGKNLKSLAGVDFSRAMIAAAKEAKRERGLGDAVSFETGDIRALPFRDGAFDVVYTTRALINLPSWDDQVIGITECLRVAKRRVILSEGFWEPLVMLNAMRTLVQLPPLVEHDFNRYLKKARLEHLINSLGHAFSVDEFSGVYYIGSRFLRELVTDAAAWPGYTNPVNALFCEIERQYDAKGFGIQQAYIVEKK
jgi:ubiquinone/menaquinone biosynthesis C-methylase UbiE